MKINRKTLYLGAFVYAFVLLFFLSPDSYLQDVFQRCDSAWFFMCGKAWMNGMVPYVDFADSKGPLLWLIYGCGYLLSHHSYVGVFWLSCLFYTATFVIAYRLARLFVDAKSSLIVVALLPWTLLFRMIHYEVRAEDFCYFFVMASLFCSFKFVRDRGGEKPFWPAFCIGVCLMCCLLIKWNIAIMLSGTALVVLVYAVKNNDWHGIAGGMLGLLAMALPFFVYFLAQGNMQAFINEYFLATYSTVIHQSPWQLLAGKCLHPNICDLFPLLVLLGVALLRWRYKLSRYIFLVPVPFIILSVTPSLDYYYTIVTPLSIAFIIFVVDWVMARIRLSNRNALLVACLLAGIGLLGNFKARHPLCFQDNYGRQAFYDMEAFMSQKEHPLVMCYNMDNSIGVVADALPACKYWALQNGATTAMHAERTAALKARKADFIIVCKAKETDDVGEANHRNLSSNGYVYCGVTVGEAGALNQFVYCRREIYKKLTHVHFTTTDLLLKRSIIKKNIIKKNIIKRK